MRLIKVEATTPCCSAAGPVPESIPPGGKVELSTTFRVGSETGRKRVGFLVLTDDPNRPTHTLSLTADLYSEWELKLSGSDPGRFPVGRGGELSFDVVSRRRGDEGLNPPGSVEADEPLGAELGGPRADDRPNGITEAVQRLVVKIPPCEEPGARRAAVVFRWADGTTRTFDVAWEVVPRLRATPSGLVVKRSDEPSTAKVRVGSDGRPFRVLNVAGELLGAEALLPPGAARDHVLVLTIDPSRCSSGEGGVREVTITTDHPDQPVVKVSVLVLPTSPQ